MNSLQNPLAGLLQLPANVAGIATPAFVEPLLPSPPKLANGRIRFQGTAKELENNEEIRRMHLMI